MPPQDSPLSDAAARAGLTAYMAAPEPEPPAPPPSPPSPPPRRLLPPPNPPPSSPPPLPPVTSEAFARAARAGDLVLLARAGGDAPPGEAGEEEEVGSGGFAPPFGLQPLPPLGQPPPSPQPSPSAKPLPALQPSPGLSPSPSPSPADRPPAETTPLPPLSPSPQPQTPTPSPTQLSRTAVPLPSPSPSAEATAAASPAPLQALVVGNATVALVGLRSAGGGGDAGVAAVPLLRGELSLAALHDPVAWDAHAAGIDPWELREQAEQEPPAPLPSPAGVGFVPQIALHTALLDARQQPAVRQAAGASQPPTAAQLLALRYLSLGMLSAFTALVLIGTGSVVKAFRA
jgi:hypothetical protein